jgi:Amt family ammonium transporter
LILPPATAAICGLLIFLIPFALAGIALMNSGLGRSRTAAHSLMACLAVAAVAAIAYAVFGFAWQGYAGRAAYAFAAGGKQWSWIGAERLFLLGLDFEGSPSALAASLGMFSAALAASIPLGAGAERWRLAGAMVSTAVLAGWTYPVFAHWVWGGGWLAQLGSNYGLGSGFADAGGAGTIQVVGGFSALSVAWILGPRRGKYSHEGLPAAIPGHNTVFVLFGCFLTWIGWVGLNSAGAILFYGASPARIALIALNTTLAAGSALLATAMVTRARFSKPDASLSANGWVAGLVGSSASAAFMTPPAAVIVGLVAGALVPLCIEWLELHLGVDDPGGSIAVHGVCGLWGLLAAGIVARFPGGSTDQLQAQLAGIATLLGFVFPFIYGVNWLLNRFVPFRVRPEGERQGLDLTELGANAYPELAGHLEDFTQR